MAQSPESEEWLIAFPAPKAMWSTISADEVMKIFDDMDIKSEPKSFLLVDVRREDWEGGTIRSAINLPAQSFYQTRKTLLDSCDRASIKTLIFSGCTSDSRAACCAGWMQDYIEDIMKFGRRTTLGTFVLKGGITGWVKDFDEALVDGYVERHWS